MGLQIIGAGSSTLEIGAFAAKGAHIIAKPTDIGSLGQYRVSTITGTMAAALAASAQVWQFKWTDATRGAVIKSIRTRFKTLTRFTAGTITDFGFDAFVVRSFAAGGGGTTLTLTGDNQQMRTNMSASLGQINISTTAALTAATTLDAHPFAQSFGAGAQVTPSATVANEELPCDINYVARLGDGEYPLMLVQNEGVVIRNRVAWPVAGTGIIMVECVWAEVTAF